MPQKIPAPDGYNQVKISEILSDIKNVNSNNDIGKMKDIIFIQCESLYDLSLIVQPYWNEDPLYDLKNSKVERLQYGYFLSPMNGGGTCNVEYEVLTGYRYDCTNGTPYMNMIDKDYISIVSVLKENGYQTSAIHTNTGAFFNRVNVYNNMGFDKEFLQNS